MEGSFAGVFPHCTTFDDIEKNKIILTCQVLHKPKPTLTLSHLQYAASGPLHSLKEPVESSPPVRVLQAQAGGLQFIFC
jgi:hypothetical protein